jgi:porin
MKRNLTGPTLATAGFLACFPSSAALGGTGDTKQAGTTPEPAPSLCGDHLLGDVWGLRKPAETGLDFRLEATNFYHGVIDGDPNVGSIEGGDDLKFAGKLDLFMNLDGHKAGLWPGFFASVHGEYRYGDNSRQAGALSPDNAALLSPGTEGELFALSNVTLTQALSESFLVTLGKFNTIDLADRRFYGGRGTEGFLNTSLVAMPIAGRTFPVSALGAVATVLQDGAPFVNFGVMDSLSPITSPGWDHLSADEMTVFADITFRTDLDGRLGTHTLSASYSTIDAYSFDQSDLIRPPGSGPRNAARTDDSWQISYLWEQSLTRNAAAPERGWGTFLFLALSDGNPNPFEYSIATGLVANGVGAARPCDSFGLGLFYNGVSSDLRRTLSNNRPPLPSIGLQDELGAEIFYEIAVTDWFRLAVDLQLVQPAVQRNGTAVVGGLRSRIVF